MTEILQQIQYAVSLALFGLIWTIQLVHYPAFKYVDTHRFVAFEKMHTFKITLFVAPLMMTELIAAGMLMYLSGFTNLQVILFIIVVLIWASTFLISVPLHQKLSRGKDDGVIAKLILTNWIRTLLWSLKVALLIVYYYAQRA